MFAIFEMLNSARMYKLRSLIGKPTQILKQIIISVIITTQINKKLFNVDFFLRTFADDYLLNKAGYTSNDQVVI